MKKELTIPELIRHLNHEFLNRVNLIQMNLDLGKIDECKRIIKEMAEQFRIVSNINQLKCPKLITWLDTFTYNFPAINYQLNSDVIHPIPIHLDEKITNYLDDTIHHIYDELDPYMEHNLILSVLSNENKFEIHFDLKGNWNVPKFNTKVDDDYIIDTYEQTNESWKYVIRSK